MGKRIGIITYHNADNLGAVLQAYALQRTLDSLGADVQVVDYHCPGIEATTQKSGGFRGMALRGYYFLKHREFDRFRRKKLKVSREYNRGNVDRCLKDYDLFITGSDQVWNYECSGWDDTYFLDFVPDEKPKYSYAASLGLYRFRSEEKDHVQSLLRRFCDVSVRETSGREELQTMGISAKVHPDPVFLLSKDEWSGIMPPRPIPGRYVLVYLVLPDVNVLASAEQYACQHNCRIINNKKSIEFMLQNSPSDLLSWVNYAECVFTNSFHGTAFSLIFNRPLAADVQTRDGKINNRVMDLLTASGAEKCLLTPGNSNILAGDTEPKLVEMGLGGREYLRMICEG